VYIHFQYYLAAESLTTNKQSPTQNDNNMKQTITLLAALFIAALGANATTYTISSSTSWGTTQTNALGANDVININSGVTLTITSGSISPAVTFNVTGTLSHSGLDLTSTGSKIQILTFGSVVNTGGSGSKLVIGNGGTKFTHQSGPGTLSSTGIYSASGFTATGGTPLPVSLLNFSATASDGRINLSFEVAMEKNISYYEVERSTDGSNFSKTGITATANNEDDKFTYTLTDLNPAAGTNYYRLVINSTDGKAVNSNITSAKIKAAASFEPAIFPNPATSSINITTNNAAVDYSVVDMSGRTLIAGSFTVDATKKLDITSLAKGNYILTMNSNGQTKAVSFVKIAD
jgi:hypothetical protein